jgi:G:T-mismatch repair DNA endonuclease (very short patch repair protein)
MDNLSIFLFAIAGISTLVGAFYLMHSAATSEPMKNYRTGTWTKTVTRPVHPEMKDVEPGTQLMGVNFEQKTECDLEEYKDLQARIAELKAELEDQLGDDDEEDDDGDIIVRV